MYIDPKERIFFSQGKLVKYFFLILLHVINSYLLIEEDQ